MEEIKCVLVRTPIDKSKDTQILGTMSVFKGVHKIYETKVLELPWKDNRRSISCIPDGDYWIDKRPAEDSPTQKIDHFIIRDVPDRTYILWHAGNYHWNIQGCQLHGQAFTDINNDGLLDVTNTKFTIAHLNSILPDRFRYKIITL